MAETRSTERVLFSVNVSSQCAARCFTAWMSASLGVLYFGPGTEAE